MTGNDLCLKPVTVLGVTEIPEVAGD